jgi:glycosyltransferase involved in cell wall biosynthesis
MKRISIVTPSFNQGRFLREALESVRMQGHDSVEHLVVDGGSSDESVPLLRALETDVAWSHLRWSSAPDRGQSDALNRGFRLGSGEIVGWLNSDDRYRAGCFDRVLKAFDENPDVDIFYGDFTFMDEKGKVLKVRREIEFNRFILLYHRVLYIPSTATFFRRRVFEDGHLLREDLHYAMDYEFFLRLASEGYRIRRMPYVLADFRLHAQSKTCLMERTQLSEKQEIMRTFSPVAKRLPPGRLQRTVFFGLQVAAGIMRWSQKLLHGAYFRATSSEGI